MKDLIARSQSLEETAQVKKGLVWILELLVFLAVFLVSSIAQSIFLFPAELVFLFSDDAYMAAVAGGDVTDIAEATMLVSERMVSSDAYMIVTLFSDIALIVLVCLFCRFLQKRKLRTLGFVKKDIWKEYSLGMLLGFGFFSVCVGLGLVTGAYTFGGLAADFSVGMFLLYLLGYMVQGMAEEVLCRGYFLGSYARRYPLYAAVLANSLFFAALHLLNSGITVLAFINLTLFGIFASLYFIRRGNIWGIGAFHTVWNLVQGNFYGILVSGVMQGNTLMTMVPKEGRELLSGGSFGMEGGLICTAVYLAGIIWLLFCKNKDGGEIVQPIEEKMEEFSEALTEEFS